MGESKSLRQSVTIRSQYNTSLRSTAYKHRTYCINLSINQSITPSIYQPIIQSIDSLKANQLTTQNTQTTNVQNHEGIILIIITFLFGRL